MSGTIYEKSGEGRPCFRFAAEMPPAPDSLPEVYLRKGPIGLPQVSEPQAMRHYVGLSVKNHHVDKDLFPLGSCTMKYNPKINEDIAALPGFSGLHPEQPTEDIQGALHVMNELEDKLAEANRKLNELQQAKDPANAMILSPEQEDEIAKLRTQEVETRRKLRQVKRDLRAEMPEGHPVAYPTSLRPWPPTGSSSCSR